MCLSLWLSDSVYVCVYVSEGHLNLPLLSILSECHTRLSDQLQERGNERIRSVTFVAEFKRAYSSVFACVCVSVWAVFPCQSARLHGSTSWSVYGMSEQLSIHSCVFASLRVFVSHREGSVCVRAVARNSRR